MNAVFDSVLAFSFKPSVWVPPHTPASTRLSFPESSVNLTMFPVLKDCGLVEPFCSNPLFEVDNYHVHLVKVILFDHGIFRHVYDRNFCTRLDGAGWPERWAKSDVSKTLSNGLLMSYWMLCKYDTVVTWSWKSLYIRQDLVYPVWVNQCVTVRCACANVGIVPNNSWCHTKVRDTIFRTHKGFVRLRHAYLKLDSGNIASVARDFG